MDFAYTGVCGNDDDVEYKEREEMDRENCISERTAVEVWKDKEDDERLGGPKDDVLDEDLSDVTGMRKELLKKGDSDLIGVKKVFDRLKEDLGLSEEERQKQ